MYKIYILISPNDEKDVRYVGMTLRPLEVRLRGHYSKLNDPGQNKDKVIWMRSFTEKIIIKQIDSAETKKEAAKLELYYINKYVEEGNTVYNRFGNKLIDGAKSVPVYCFDLEGNFIMKYPSLARAVKNFGSISVSNIGRAAKTGTLYRNFRWSYSPKLYINPGIKVGRTVYRYDLKGNYIDEFKTGREANRVLGISYKNISAVCVGTKNTCEGFIWSFEKKDKIVPKKRRVSSHVKEIIRVDEEGEEVIFRSLGKLIEVYPELNRGKVLWQCHVNKKEIKGKGYAGYMWRYKV